MRNIAPLLTFALCLASLLPLRALAQPALPYADGQIHEGVATCAGANCHGANQPLEGSNVLQNEYYIWTREDRHAQAYKTLLNKDSKKIGRRLGLTPEKSPRCLNCHSNYVPENRRGKRFRLADGVSCEACHGGAGNWLQGHVASDATHAKNVAAGLFPSEDPLQRGRLCLSCHLGDADHAIDHEIMGAGHPPLGFELDTFTAIEPAHHDLDADYDARKGVRSSAQTWVDGQMISAQRYLEEVASSRIKQGLFPELVFFDCYACHHELSGDRWDSDTATGLGPGRVRLHTVNLILLEEIFKVLDPAQAKALNGKMRKLNQASQQSISSLQAAASSAAQTVAAAIKLYGGKPVNNAQAWALFDKVSKRALNTPDFNLAEQSNMAMEALYLTLDQRGQIGSKQSRALRAALDKGYNYTNAAKDYSASGFASVIRSIRANIKTQ